jgi:hypothetical protein
LLKTPNCRCLLHRLHGGVGALRPLCTILRTELDLSSAALLQEVRKACGEGEDSDHFPKQTGRAEASRRNRWDRIPQHRCEPAAGGQSSLSGPLARGAGKGGTGEVKCGLRCGASTAQVQRRAAHPPFALPLFCVCCIVLYWTQSTLARRSDGRRSHSVGGHSPSAR